MKASELRELSITELENKISEAKKNLFNLKFQKASGQLENSMKIKNLKRDIARIETVAKEKEIALQKEEIKKDNIVSKKKNKSDLAKIKKEQEEVKSKKTVKSKKEEIKK
jgi:large subunit ribosomal protein L29